MSFAIGIVGLPNVGKSTLFKALTKQQVDIANYPFATIDPNVGIVSVPDDRLQKLSDVSGSAKIIPTTIEFNDIAGLVKGASKGEGLGNQFLGHIRSVDAIAHVLRVFTDGDVTHVAGRVDPTEDRDVIQTELMLADMATVDQVMKRIENLMKGGDKEAVAQWAVLEKIKTALEAGEETSSIEVPESVEGFVKGLHLLTRKPVLYVLNADEGVTEESLPDDLKALPHVILSAKIEAELVDLGEEGAAEMMAEMGMDRSGLDKLIVASYELLDLITFFTSGEKETRAWTVQRGASAPQAAGRIHTDFEEGFIRAEVVNWEEMVKAGSWNGAKEAGKLAVEGKDYITQDGDVMIFRFAN